MFQQSRQVISEMPLPDFILCVFETVLCVSFSLETSSLVTVRNYLPKSSFESKVKKYGLLLIVFPVKISSPQCAFSMLLQYFYFVVACEVPLNSFWYLKATVPKIVT